jgi:hypothetical protein
MKLFGCVELWNDVDNWKNITKSQNRVRKKCFGGTFCFTNCHIIGLDTGGLVFLVSGLDLEKQLHATLVTISIE